MPKSISALSWGLMYSIFRFTFGRFMPLWLLILPPCITVPVTVVPVVSSTFMTIFPSLMSTRFPGLTSCGRSLYVTETILSVPSTLSVVSVNFCPSLSISSPFTKLPVLISGPLVSSITAAAIPISSLTFLNVSMVFL